MASLFPIDRVDDLDQPEMSTDAAGDETHAHEGHVTFIDELEIPPELIGVPFS